MAAAAGEPSDVAADGVATDLDPAVIAVGGLQPVEGGRRRLREGALDLGVERRPVALTARR
jgi:hypothetical protein